MEVLFFNIGITINSGFFPDYSPYIINIHTRSTNNAGSGDGAWSWGCQLIGTGGTSGNPFNEFMKVVALLEGKNMNKKIVSVN